jgi:type IV secretion system protein TrbI
MSDPTLSDQRKSPTGVLPKNIQAWVMVGIALLIVAVVALSGKKAPATPANTQAGGGVPVAGALDETNRQIQELKAAQERLQQEAILSQQQQQLAQVTATPEPTPAAAATPEPGEDLAAAARKRDYTSLFASQMAASYRAGPVGKRSPPARVEGLETADATAQPEAGEAAPQLASDGSPPPPPATVAPAATPPATQQAASRPRHDTSNRAQPGAREFTLFEGTVLESALLTRLNSDATGPVIVTTTAPIYSRNRQKVLVPAGTRVLGEAKKVETTGQTRLAVSFHRLIMPDGYAVDLDHFVGLSGLGETALKDQVNNHYVKMFGASIALGLLGGLSAFGTQTPALGASVPVLDTYRQGVAASFGQEGARILDRFTNILPTLTIREGHRLRVYLTQDLLLPAYDEHTMPKDL